MNLHTFHNTVRKLYNVEWSQLHFLTDTQKDNFFENPPRFFIAADDETAEKLWDVMFPKPPEAVGGEAGVESKVVIDLAAYRKAAGLPAMPEQPRKYQYWCPPNRTDFEYDTGRAYPLPTPNTAADVPVRTFIMNSAPVSALAG